MSFIVKCAQGYFAQLDEHSQDRLGETEMKTETIDDHVRFRMTRLRLIPGGLLNLYSRRTWTPFGDNYITDYGVELIGFALWLHIPDCIQRILGEPQ